jgi:hypothetical protein
MHGHYAEMLEKLGAEFGRNFATFKRILTIDLFGCADFYMVATNLSSVVTTICYYTYIQLLTAM